MTEIFNQGIPLSTSLEPVLESENIEPKIPRNKKRLLYISSLAVLIAITISFIARLLVYFIDFITNISFYGRFSFESIGPASNHLGLFVIIVPVIGGLIVGLMAVYGHKGIRGHGIPEAMEQILTNQSKIKPSITFLKPISAAISMGTGGPFGAEGPIIATGGAFGSTIGQILHISHHERKILLAAGATAGMSAIFGTPIAAIFLAIELLLFEFSPRSIIPVAAACITGAAGHHYLFGGGPAFPMPELQELPDNIELLAYSVLGLFIGIASVGVTRIVYWIEDSFEKLPIHWFWWPAMGGIAVGAIGYFFPHTLGVGYDNITSLLSGSLAIKVMIGLCFFKFLSWAIALGSGTSGGTLAPLLTIGGGAGALFGSFLNYIFPSLGLSVPMAALIGMSAMFAGASRALLTSIIFALEATDQSHAILPLLAGCSASYIVSFFLMENTIMTEKIARRGIKTPHSFEADILEKVTVGQVMEKKGFSLDEESSLIEVTELMEREPHLKCNYLIVTNKNSQYRGMLSLSNILSEHHDKNTTIGTLIKRRRGTVAVNDSLRVAVELMASENMDVLPVIDANAHLLGRLTYKNIISAYKLGILEHEEGKPVISLRRQSLKAWLRGQKAMNAFKDKVK